MKKYIISILASLLLFSCVGLTAFADETAPSISDDYNTIRLEGESYSRFNASLTDTNYHGISTGDPVTLELTESQKETIAKAFVRPNESKSMLYLTVNFTDGATFTAEYMKDDLLQKYKDLLNSPSASYVVDFEYPEGNTIDVSKTLLFADSLFLDDDTLDRCDHYPVTLDLGDDCITVHTGALLIKGDKFYYVDFEENNITTSWFDPYGYDELLAYEITDPTLLADLEEGKQAFYDDDFGFFFDDEFTKNLSYWYLMIVFAILPFVILVLFLILAIRTKTIYRKLFAIICTCAGAELVVFAILAVIFHIG